MSALLGLASLRILFGLAGFGYSLLKADFNSSHDATLTNEILKAIVGQVTGGVAYDALKGGAAGLESLWQSRDEPLNHDLQRAARQAQLTATLLAVRACLVEIKRAKANEKPFWSKAIGLFNKDADEAWLKEIAQRWQQKIERLPKEVPPPVVEGDQLLALFDPASNRAPSEIQEQLISQLKEDALAELRVEQTNVSPIPDAAYKMVEEAIRHGWNEFAEDTAYLTSLKLPRRLYPPEQKASLINLRRQFDWFGLVCGLFNEAYKRDEKVSRAMQKYLLLDLRNRQGQPILDKDGQPVGPGVILGHLEQFADSFARLDHLLESVDTRQDEILGFVKSFIEENRRLHEETQRKIIAAIERVEASFGEKLEDINRTLAQMQSPTPEQQRALNAVIAAQREANIREAEARRQPSRISGTIPRLKYEFVDRDAARADLRRQVGGDGFPVVVIKGASGYGKTALLIHLLREAAPAGIVYFSCDAQTGDTRSLLDVFSKAEAVASLSAATAGQRTPLIELFNRYARKDGLSLEALMRGFYADLSQVGAVWLAFDNFEDMMSGDHIADHEIKALFDAAAEYAGSVKLILTTQNEPVFDGSHKLKPVEIVEGLPVEDAIRFLRHEGARAGLDQEDEDVLRRFVEYVHGIPAALAAIVDYITQEKRVRLAELLDPRQQPLLDGFNQYDTAKGLRSLIADQFRRQPMDEKLMVSALAVFRDSMPAAALRFMFPSFDWHEMARKLEHNTLVAVDRAGLYDLTRGTREYVYEQIPLVPSGETTESGDLALFNRRDLHTRAADYFASIRLPEERWKTLADFAPQFEEMYHCYEAGLYDRAVGVIDSGDDAFLRRAGYARQLVAERQKLVDKPMHQSSHAYNLNCLGNARADLGESHQAREHYEQALAFFREVGDRVYEGRVLGNIGLIYSESGENPKALEYLEQALIIHREVGDRASEGRALGNIGIVYANQGGISKALGYYEQELAIQREIGNRVDEGRVLGNIGEAYSNLEENRKALEYYEQALAIQLEVGDHVGEGFVLGSKGIAMFKLGNKEEGIRLVEQALEIARQVEDKIFEDIWVKRLAEMKS
ncbi:MAG TPA: tetratricopeptide repeat protein [Blastocatellia bacterium]|nr:tetratricopeptide repeat protein [Blastocatellia bacterium]